MKSFSSKLLNALTTKTSCFFMALVGMFLILNSNHALAADILAGQDTLVKDTFGSDSTITKWFILADVIVSLIAYIATKNIKVFFSVLMVMIFINVGIGLAGY